MLHHVPVWVWLTTILAVLGLVAVDLVVSARRGREATTRESIIWSVFYLAVAVVFGGLLAGFAGRAPAGAFAAGYVLEKALSVDNLFVFAVLIGAFSVPAHLRERVILVGITVSLVVRGLFIWAGAAAIDHFAFVGVLLGAFLIWTAFNLFRSRHDDAEAETPALVRLMRRVVPTTDGYRGSRLLVRDGGRWLVTPLLVVMVALGLTDVVFALDSIPATFAVTTEPYLVFTANAFALLGLRALYFVVTTGLARLRYLSTGLAVVLAVVGVKLVAGSAGWVHVPVSVSLGVVALVLGVTVTASLLADRRDARAAALQR